MGGSERSWGGGEVGRRGAAAAAAAAALAHPINFIHQLLPHAVLGLLLRLRPRAPPPALPLLLLLLLPVRLPMRRLALLPLVSQQRFGAPVVRHHLKQWSGGVGWRVGWYLGG